MIGLEMKPDTLVILFATVSRAKEKTITGLVSRFEALDEKSNEFVDTRDYDKIATALKSNNASVELTFGNRESSYKLNEMQIRDNVRLNKLDAPHIILSLFGAFSPAEPEQMTNYLKDFGEYISAQYKNVVTAETRIAILYGLYYDKQCNLDKYRYKTYLETKANTIRVEKLADEDDDELVLLMDKYCEEEFDIHPSC